VKPILVAVDNATQRQHIVHRCSFALDPKAAGPDAVIHGARRCQRMPFSMRASVSGILSRATTAARAGESPPTGAPRGNLLERSGDRRHAGPGSRTA